MSKGVKIGLKNLHYALLLTDGATGTTYGVPKAIKGVTTANINPNASVETLFADDGPYETAATTGQITLELTVADLPIEVQAELLGHTIDSAGIMRSKADDIPPTIAVGFESIKSNGSKRFVWLTKGKFSEFEDNNETKGDSVSFQTPSIQGSFVSRESDKEYKLTADEDLESFTMPAGGWYSTSVITVAIGV